jgi:hypothetical protein
MTLIGASVRPDHVLIASDSCAVNSAMGAVDDRRVKLWPLADRPLVWGYYGPETVGDTLHRWLDGLPKDHGGFKSWEAFGSLVAEGMAMLNGEMVKRAGLRGVPIQPEETVVAQIAGYIDGEPRIMIAWQNGHVGFNGEAAFYGSPSGFGAAMAVWRTLEQERKAIALDRETLHNVMEIASRLTAGCGPPIQMWKVTPDAVEQIQ